MLGLAWLSLVLITCYSHGSGSFLFYAHRGDPSAASGSGRTGGTSDRSTGVVLRDASGEPHFPLDKGKAKLMRLNIPGDWNI